MALDSSDPVRSPKISVAASQGGTNLVLDPVEPNDVFPGQHLYYKFIDFDPGLTGSWEITPTDSTGIGLSSFTDPIVDPEFIPLVENIKVQGTPLGARVSWTLPNLNGFDVDGSLVGILESVSGRQVFQSELFPVQTNSFDAPAGVLQPGVDYVWGIVLADLEGDHAENASNAFSEPFRYTIAGDFNTDGTVDAADYVVWRNGLGTTYAQNDYGRVACTLRSLPGSWQRLGATLRRAAVGRRARADYCTAFLIAIALLSIATCRGPWWWPKIVAEITWQIC